MHPPATQPAFLDPGDLPRWDRFVAGHSGGTLFHTTRWRDVIEGAFPHMRGHFLALTDDRTGAITAGLVAYRVASWILGNRLVSVPYANWCEPLAGEGHELDALAAALEVLARQSGARKVELRCRSAPAAPLPGGWSPNRSWVHHSTDLGAGPGEVWRGTSRTAVRRFVKRAQASGVVVVEDRSESGLREFYACFAASRKRLGLPTVPYRFFAGLHAHLDPDERPLCIARLDGAMVGGVLGIVSGPVFHLEFAAAGERSRDLGVMQLLYWKAIEIACRLGCREFSFGRTAADHAGLLAYKRHWNTDEHTLPVYQWTRSGERDDGRAGALAKPVFRWCFGKMPDALFRATGSIFYRHWG